HPLWQIYFVPQYEGGCAVIGRFHHCIGDGLAMLYVLQMLSDDPPSALTGVPAATPPSAANDKTSWGWRMLKRFVPPLVAFTRTVEASLVSALRAVIAHPASARDAMRDAMRGLALGAGTVWKIAFMRSDPRTVFKGPPSGEKRAVWARPIPIDTLKAIARQTGSTINDVILAAVAGGLRRYLIACDKCDKCDKKVVDHELRALVPVNLRPVEEASELGNHFGLLFVPLPLRIDDPLERLFAVRNTTQQIKRSPERRLTFLLLKVLGIMPSPLFEMVVNLFGRRCTVMTTNVVGPREPLRMAGTTLKQVLFWIPCSGHLGTGISMCSYFGNLWLGIATDGRLVPDPEVIIAGVEAEMATLAERASQGVRHEWLETRTAGRCD
ncbi:MAG: WS/DGAT domain-containing protein, partial [Nitrososphaerota archaeon]